MEKIDSKKLETFIKYCPSCKQLTIFKFNGNLEFNLPDEEETILLRLYDCKKCKSTLSLDYILTYHAQRQLNNYRKQRRNK